MKSIIKNVRELDYRMLIGVGVSLAIIIIVLLLIHGKRNETNLNNTESNSQLLTETDFVDEGYQTESEAGTEDVQINDTQASNMFESETNAEDTHESENQKAESDKQNNTKPSVPSDPMQSPADIEDSNKNESQLPTDSENTPVVTETYTINVVSKGGHNLYNVKIHAYVDETMTNLFATASTNGKGVATMQLETGKDYTIVLSNVPLGYHLSMSYQLTGKTTTIVLESDVVTGGAFPSKKLKVGNVMYDFIVPGADGNNIRLSEVLKTKELVMLNFWYVNCQFCVMEFPFMSNVYNQYKDRVEIVALNPFDDMSAVNSFLAEKPLPFKVAICESSIPSLFGVDAYPVSVIIDKYGVIREIEEGAILQENGFVRLFDKYL